MRPHRVFACIDLIKQVSTRKARQKTVRKVSKNVHVHHGDLEVRGVLKADTLTIERHQVTAGQFDVQQRTDK